MSIPYASDAQKNYLLSLSKKAGKPVDPADLTWINIIEAGNRIQKLRQLIDLKQVAEHLKETHSAIEMPEAHKAMKEAIYNDYKNVNRILREIEIDLL